MCRMYILFICHHITCTLHINRNVQLYSGIVRFPVTARFSYNSWFTAEVYLEVIVPGPTLQPTLICNDGIFSISSFFLPERTNFHQQKNFSFWRSPGTPFAHSKYTSVWLWNKFCEFCVTELCAEAHTGWVLNVQTILWWYNGAACLAPPTTGVFFLGGTSVWLWNTLNFV